MSLNAQWVRTYGGSRLDYADSIQQTSDGGYIVAGYTGSFGAGEYDIWISKLYSDGDIDSSCGFIGSSDASVADTFVSGEDTSIIPQATSVIPLPTGVFPQNTFVTANLLCEAPKYDLTITATEGGTTDPVPDTYIYYSGKEVQIEAIAEDDYRFSGWTGDASGTSNPITITIDSNKSITASFSAIPTGDGGDGDDGKTSPCFIATAAYGSPLHPHVKSLQDFRDKYLMPTKLGRSLVGLYYKYSPFVANFIARHKALKVIVRNQLVPFVAFSYMTVHLRSVVTTIMFVLVLAISIFSISFYRRRLI